MATLEANLKAATEAVDFVKKKMVLGAKNKLKDLWRSGGSSAGCVDDVRASEEKHDKELSKAMESGLLDLRQAQEQQIETMALFAGGRGCGNCEEQAAMAFIFLRDKGEGVFPLDLMQKPNKIWNLGGHAFVVIGREENSDPSDPGTWGPNAVVADPHETESAFLAKEVIAKFGTARYYCQFRMTARSKTSLRVLY